MLQADSRQECRGPVAETIFFNNLELMFEYHLKLIGSY
jgi:hypothetical protein